MPISRLEEAFRGKAAPADSAPKPIHARVAFLLPTRRRLLPAG